MGRGFHKHKGRSVFRRFGDEGFKLVAGHGAVQADEIDFIALPGEHDEAVHDEVVAYGVHPHHFPIVLGFHQELVLAFPDETVHVLGQFFCDPSNAEYGAAFAKSNNTGRPLCSVMMKNIGLTTSYVQCFAWGLPVTCENPEAAVAAMNLIFENKDVANLLVWGIRGRDYELDENGCAYRLEGHTYEALEYFQGNQFNAYPPVQPEGSEYRQNQWNDNVNGYISPFFGLNIDNTEIANELTAVQNVMDKYYPVIACGQVAATDEYLAEFEKEMNAAGMQKIIDFYQEAVDEWLGK